ncbi:MAG TPA: hypothetical protein VL201_00590 [Patescibacteria group bacterium]|jgi:hypothetical protein|nr:hypothetical protein [Patescibacteria group bacterium]
METRNIIDLNSVPDGVIINCIFPNIIPDVIHKLLIVNSNIKDNENNYDRDLYNPMLLFTDQDQNSILNIKLINKKFYKSFNSWYVLTFQLTETVKNNPKGYSPSNLFSVYQQQLLERVTFNVESPEAHKNEVNMWIEGALLDRYQIKFCFRFKSDSIYRLIPVKVTCHSCALATDLKVSEEVKRYFDLLNKTVTQLLYYSKGASGYGASGSESGYCKKFFEIYLCENTEITENDALLFYALLQQFLYCRKILSIN